MGARGGGGVIIMQIQPQRNVLLLWGHKDKDHSPSTLRIRWFVGEVCRVWSSLPGWSFPSDLHLWPTVGGASAFPLGSSPCPLWPHSSRESTIICSTSLLLPLSGSPPSPSRISSPPLAHILPQVDSSLYPTFPPGDPPSESLLLFPRSNIWKMFDFFFTEQNLHQDWFLSASINVPAAAQVWDRCLWK